MTLGGLKQGVTPLDMAHAYETFASGGELVYGSLSPARSADRARRPGPVGHRAIGAARSGKLPTSSTRPQQATAREARC